MTARELSIRCRPYSELAFKEEVGKAAHADFSDPPLQVAYLASYLRDLRPKPKSMLIEGPYVDRHFLQEYAGYYATMLHPPSSHATRIHFVAEQLDDAGFTSLLEQASLDGSGDHPLRGDNYLGYTVVRPIPTCPIGRTVLRYYEDPAIPARCYAPASTWHDVHLAGLTLRVQGLPFQQQDQGLGACATTALWCALSRVTRTDGKRAPTPLEVTHAALGGASLHAIENGSQGLDLDQFRCAVRAFGYVPHWLPCNDPQFFALTLKAYLRSGVPVVLRYRLDGGELHAATAVGFRECDENEPCADLEYPTRSKSLRSAGVARLYVHDDRLGPYARVYPSFERRGDYDTLCLRFDARGSIGMSSTEKARVEGALIPLYPKLRLNAESLLAYACDYWPLLSMVVGERRDELRIEPMFALGGDYLARMGQALSDPSRVARARRTALLSRYVGVLRFFVGDAWLLDVVLDTTDVKRDGHDNAPVLLLASADPALSQKFVESGIGARAVVA